MANLILNGSTSGSITLAAPAVANTTTLTLPTTSGTVMVNGPAFSAYAGTTTSLTGGAFTKVGLDTEEYDTNNNFASSRFTPTVAGYYQLNGYVSINSNMQLAVTIYKNGAEYKRGSNVLTTSNGSMVSSLVYANGTTDYFEIYAYAGTTVNSNTYTYWGCYFNGFLARSA